MTDDATDQDGPKPVTMVFQYGLRPPTENAELVGEQMWLSHKYRNRLIEIERARRAAVGAAISSRPEVSDLEAELATVMTARDAARDEILKTRAKSRKRSETTEQRQAVKDLNAQIAQIVPRLKEARKAIAADPEIKARMKEADEASKEAVRQARASCGVYWGTYLLQEAAADQARTSKTPPNFMRYNGSGRVSVQIQKGIDLDTVFGCEDTRVRVVPVPPEAHDPGERRGVRRRGCRTTLMLRVSSGEKGKPVWATFPMAYHRPMPKDAVIKSVTVKRERVGLFQEEWRVGFTVAIPSGSPRPVPAEGAVALNLGFAMRPDGAIRSGYLVGSDGWESEVLVTGSNLLRGRDLSDEQKAEAKGWIVNALNQADKFRSSRDIAMDKMRDELLRWIAKPAMMWDDSGVMVESTDGHPEWFRDQVQHLAKWRAASRFHRLRKLWSASRFAGDSDIYGLLEEWCKHDLIDEGKETELRRSALLDRREAYRILASQLARRYRTLIIDDTDLTAFMEASPPEGDGRADFSPLRRTQRIAAGSELRGALQNAFGSARTYKRSRIDNTRKCHGCGFKNEIQRDITGRRHTCTNCKLEWDQDANFGRNMLADWVADEKERDADRLDNQVKKPSRSQILHAHRAKNSKRTPAEHTTGETT